MELSHRDLRAHRGVLELGGVVLALTMVLTALAMEAPWPWVGLAAVCALAIVGGLYSRRAEALLQEYRSDLSAVGKGEAVPGALRVEVSSRTSVHGTITGPSARSPNARRPSFVGVAPPQAGPRGSR